MVMHNKYNSKRIKFNWYIKRKGPRRYCIYMDNKIVGEATTYGRAVKMRNWMQRDITRFARTGKWNNIKYAPSGYKKRRKY